MNKKPIAGFWKHISTDYDNKTFDTGRSLVICVVLSMIFMEGWDVIMHTAKFDSQAFGTGVAAILAGLGAYIFGDNTKRPDVHPDPDPEPEPDRRPDRHDDPPPPDDDDHKCSSVKGSSGFSGVLPPVDLLPPAPKNRKSTPKEK